MTSIADRVLTKLAEKAEVQSEAVPKRHGNPKLMATGGLLGGSVVGSLLSSGSKAVAENSLMGQGGERATDAVLKKLQKFEPAAGLPRFSVPREELSSYATKPTGYMKQVHKLMPEMVQEMVKKEQINLPDKVNPFIAAHEVGHASGGRVAKTLMRHRLPIMLGSGLGGLGLLAHAAATGERGEGMGATGYAAPAVAAAMPVLTQAEELRATLKAKKLLGKAKIKVPNLGRMMRGQQLNYLLGGLGAVAPVAGGALALHHYLKSKDEGPKDV